MTNLGVNDTYTVIEKGPLRVTVRVDIHFALPISSSLNARSRLQEKVVCPLSIFISLNALSRYVNIQVKFDNRVKDHRLRAYFRPEIKTDKVYVDGHFDILTRDTKLPKHLGWMEKPSSTQPQRNFVALQNKTRGFAVLNKGLIQYEATDEVQPSLYITLLRCIGYLSKDGIEERRGHHCGPALPTPGAQCLGEHTFEYAVYPYNPSKTSLLEIHKAGQEFNAPLKTVDIAGRKGTLPRELSFCRVKGAIGSAYKKAEDSDDIIIRLYNIFDSSSPTEIELFLSLIHI